MDKIFINSADSRSFDFLQLWKSNYRLFFQTQVWLIFELFSLEINFSTGHIWKRRHVSYIRKNPHKIEISNSDLSFEFGNKLRKEKVQEYVSNSLLEEDIVFFETILIQVFPNHHHLLMFSGIFRKLIDQRKNIHLESCIFWLFKTM